MGKNILQIKTGQGKKISNAHESLRESERTSERERRVTKNEGGTKKKKKERKGRRSAQREKKPIWLRLSISFPGITKRPFQASLALPPPFACQLILPSGASVPSLPPLRGFRENTCARVFREKQVRAERISARLPTPPRSFYHSGPPLFGNDGGCMRKKQKAVQLSRKLIYRSRRKLGFSGRNFCPRPALINGWECKIL